MTQSLENYEPKMVTLERGLAGCHGSLQGGGGVTIYDSRLSSYFGDLVEGGIVIDKREVLIEHPGYAVTSPMCDSRLTGNQIDRLSDCVPAEEYEARSGFGFVVDESRHQAV